MKILLQRYAKKIVKLNKLFPSSGAGSSKSQKVYEEVLLETLNKIWSGFKINFYCAGLFSGVGGFELGFQKAGFTTKWIVENDQYATKTYRYNFPDHHLIEKVNQFHLMKLKNSVM